MDNGTWIPLVAGLLGSVVTIVATKLFDYFNSEKERKHKAEQERLNFQRELQKKFFEKKMIATEETMVNCSLANLSCFQVHQVLSGFRADYKNFSSEKNHAELKEAINQFAGIKTRMQGDMLKIDLYYDQEDLGFDMSFSKYANAGNEFQANFPLFITAAKQMEDLKDKENPEYSALKLKMEECRDKAKKSLDDMITMYEMMIKSYSALQRNLRVAFRKYDA
jgi:hypothetical protein